MHAAEQVSSGLVASVMLMLLLLLLLSSMGGHVSCCLLPAPPLVARGSTLVMSVEWSGVDVNASE
jgi:hypothetical protein